MTNVGVDCKLELISARHGYTDAAIEWLEQNKLNSLYIVTKIYFTTFATVLANVNF